MQKAVPCNVNNNYNSFYAGPNCKNIEQLLVKLKDEILEEIREMIRNATGNAGGKGLYDYFDVFLRMKCGTIRTRLM